jgi:GGDEF domain-containing protein
MQAGFVRRRVLLAAGPGAEESIRRLFEQVSLKSWEAIEAGSISQARFVLQHSPCDVALVNDDLYHREGEQALAWLARHGQAPVVFLAGDMPGTMARVYHLGATMCLPRTAAQAHPPLLAAALERAAQLADAQRCRRCAQEQLAHSRRHVDRLVNLIWRSAPLEPNTRWFTQRHALDRLQEEIARTERHGGPLTLALAEVEVDEADEQIEAEPLEEWTSAVVARSKRRCDVAGHYGMQGFLLLMVHTPKHGGIICCRRLKKLLESDVVDSATGPRGPVRAYFGLASSTSASVTAQSLLHCAEQNLEAARTGKDGGVVAE